MRCEMHAGLGYDTSGLEDLLSYYMSIYFHEFICFRLLCQIPRSPVINDKIVSLLIPAGQVSRVRVHWTHLWEPEGQPLEVFL